MGRVSIFLQNPWRIFYHFNKMKLSYLVPDAIMLKILYRAKMGKKLDLKNPVTYNEKLQWLKLYDRNPEYVKLVDKYEVRDYIAKKIGGNYLIPLLGVWDNVDDIDFDSLPNQFVLKCTHDSGSVIICKDKACFDIQKAKEALRKAMGTNFYWLYREWPYKNVKPRVVAEQYLEDDETEELLDYKMMCFNGKQKCTFTCTNRFSGTGLNVTFFDTEWNKLPFERHYKADLKKINKPRSYAEMVELAEKLSEKIPFSRIDFYEINNKIYFGEITLYPGSGFEEFEPESWDETLGSWIKLPNNIRGGGGVILDNSYVIWVHNEFAPKGLTDYKVLCFNGAPKLIKCHVNRFAGNHTADFFDTSWNKMHIGQYNANSQTGIECPECLSEMLTLSEKLAQSFKHVRVDWYYTQHRLFFGEITLYHGSGLEAFENEMHDVLLGSWIKLNNTEEINE